jgi:two-component system cell cycle response regulator PopA
LPGADAKAARAAAARICAVIGYTAFDAGKNRPPFVAEFDLGVAETNPGETAAQVLERAAAKAQRARAG